jgi:hypothetical protein
MWRVICCVGSCLALALPALPGLALQACRLAAMPLPEITRPTLYLSAPLAGSTRFLSFHTVLHIPLHQLDEAGPGLGWAGLVTLPRGDLANQLT